MGGLERASDDAGLAVTNSTITELQWASRPGDDLVGHGPDAGLRRGRRFEGVAPCRR